MSKLFRKNLFILAILFNINLYANTLEKAMELFDNKGKYKDAIEIFQDFPDNSNAQYYLGKAYLFGMGVSVDYKKAIDYALDSAKENNSSGLNLMGVIYQYGYGVEKNQSQALYYYIKAAKLNNLKALVNVGNIEFENNNYNEAYNYYIKAANLDFFDVMPKIVLILERYPYLSTFKNEIEYWMLKALESKDNNIINFAEQTLNIKYLKEEKYKKLLDFQLNRYQKGSVSMGCNAASTLSNELTGYFDIEEAHRVLLEIIEIYNVDNQTLTCYDTLAFMYKMGNFFPKDEVKSIELYKSIFNNINHSNKKFVYNVKIKAATNIAEVYLNDLEDYDNAKKWYQNIYELTKDSNYLLIVDNYIKNKPIYKFEKNLEKKILPILDNFSKKEQIVAYLETEEFYLFSTANKSIRMYNKNNLQYIKEFRSWINNGISGIYTQMAYDENKKLLYTTKINSIKDPSKNSIIEVFDIDSGNIVNTLENKKARRNINLTISDDGKYLVAINNNANEFNIINIETNELQHYSNISTKLVKSKIIKKDNDYFVYFLSNDNQLYTFSISKSIRISKEDYTGQIFFEKIFKNRVNFNKDNSYKLFNSTAPNIKGLTFNKNGFNIKYSEKNLNFNFDKIQLSKNKNFKQSETNQSSIKIIPKYENKVLEVYNKDKKLLSEISLLNKKVLNYTVLDDKYILVVTTDIANMLIFTLDGKPIANLQGFNSMQNNIIYKEGILLSYGNDNLIHIFNLKSLKKLSNKKKEYDEEILNGLSKFYNGDPLDFLNDDDDKVEYLFNKGRQYKFNANQIKSYLELDLLKKETIYPIASLYIESEKDWIIYTPEGLFSYGGNGHKLLKYHQNQGLSKEAKIIENDQLFDKFYRPDLVKKILAGEKVDIPMDVKSVIFNILPPKLKILLHKMLNEKDLEVTYQVCDAGNGISNSKIIINGQAIEPPKSRGFDIKKLKATDNRCNIYKSIFTLYPGKSTIELKAFDKDKYISNNSEKLEVNADYKIVEKADLKNIEQLNNITVLDNANLYFLSVAVSDYEDNNLDLTYPVKDVTAVKKDFLEKSTSSFENIYTFELHNKRVNKKNIDEMFNKISKQIKMNDVFVLYIAGHGSTKEGKYQFIPYEMNKKISIDDIKDNLSKIATYTNKSLVLLDTCYSGTIIDNITDEATKNRLAYDSNINYIVASSSDQVALEGYKSHGVFTYSVLDAFKKKEKLNVWELANYVSGMVPKITQEKFQYSQVPQAKLNKNFILVGDRK